MLRCLAILALAGLAGARGQAPGPTVRIESGAARLVDGEHVRVLTIGAAPAALQGELASLEAGARSEVEIVWRAAASARISGPATVEVRRQPGLVLTDFRVAELEVRRGEITLVLPELGCFTLGEGVLQVRSLPGGVLELQNRGGAPLALRRAWRPALEIPAGERVRLRERRPV